MFVIDGQALNIGLQLIESLNHGSVLGIPYAHVAQWVPREQLLILNQYQAPNHLLRSISLIFDGLCLFLRLYMQGACIFFYAVFAYGAILVTTEDEILLGAHSEWQTLRFYPLECSYELNRLFFYLNDFDSAIITCQINMFADHLWIPDRTTCIELGLDCPLQQIPLNNKSVETTAQ